MCPFVAQICKHRQSPTLTTLSQTTRLRSLAAVRLLVHAGVRECLPLCRSGPVPHTRAAGRPSSVGPRRVVTQQFTPHGVPAELRDVTGRRRPREKATRATLWMGQVMALLYMGTGAAGSECDSRMEPEQRI